MAIHPKIVSPFEIGSIMKDFIVSVANQTEANPEIINALNIKENTFDTKLLERLDGKFFDCENIQF